jgi:hypothetical protein
VRTLDSTLDSLQLSATRREPAFKILVYDLRSTETAVTPTRVSDVISSRIGDPPATLPATVGPLDVTDHVLSYTLVENAGDWIDSAVAASALDLTLVDPSGELDPLNNPAPDDGKWLRTGNVVVVFEGDAQVDPDVWPAVFTGILVGQAGVSRSRVTGESTIHCSAVSREAAFLRQTSTSIEFPQGTPYNDIIEALTQDMNLVTDELAFPTTFATTLTTHLSTQTSDESPLVSIARILFVDGQIPRFDGDGRLGLSDGQVTKAAVRVYADDEIIFSIDRPQRPEDGVNLVRILGLEPNKSQVVQTRQVLARASITTGFFSFDAEIPVKWSEDGTLQAKNTRLEVKSSIGAGLFNFGDESYDEDTQADGNSLSGTIEVEGGIALGLAVVGGLLATLYLMENSTEFVEVVGLIASFGFVIRPNPVSIARAVAQQAIIQALSTIGRGQYEITGEPVEYVYKEIVGIAETKSLNRTVEEEREVEYKCDLLTSQAMVDAAAMRVLRRERAKANVRSVRMLPDLRLEPDDIFQTADDRRYMIRSISRTHRRGGEYVAEVDAFEVTAGTRP